MAKLKADAACSRCGEKVHVKLADAVLVCKNCKQVQRGEIDNTTISVLPKGMLPKTRKGGKDVYRITGEMKVKGRPKGVVRK